MLAGNRRGRANAVKANASVGFAKKLFEMRGQVIAAYISALRDVGFTDAHISEIVLLVALNFFTNLVNDATIERARRFFHWPRGRRPDDHPALTQLGL
jgi:nuclear transport factor 2 (NTF2) superfamily protein